jgi:hypothetical protein
MDKIYKKLGKRYVEVEPQRFKIDFFEFAFLVEACVPNKELDFEDMDWRYVPNYHNYIVNMYGDVISLERVIKRRNGNYQKIHSKLLKPCLDKKGYLIIRLSNIGVVKTLKVHQIVAMSFLNHTPNGMLSVVDHIDNNKTNNHYLNLQVVSSRTNTLKSLDKSKTSSSYIGVSFSEEKNKWRSAISHNNKRIHLGYFKSELDANEYYEKAMICINNDKPEDIIIKKREHSSSYKGVSKTKRGKFRGMFNYKNNFYDCGSYDNELDAYNAYLNRYNEITNGK